MPEEHSRPYADEGEVVTSLEAIRQTIALNRLLAKEQLDRIESQVRKTNGRVSKNERNIAFIFGGLSLLAALSGWMIFVVQTFIVK